jgi:hypothetical protein
MTQSQNGYSVITRDDCKSYKVDNFTVPLRADDCGYVLAKFARHFDRKIEDLGKTETFGWSGRKIANSDEYSNHASGTALDANSAQHPYGKINTFSPSEEEKLRDLLSDFDDVIRWGGDYRYSKDEMHFEINKSYAEVHLLASVLRRDGKVYLSRLAPGKRNLDVYMVKRALSKRLLFSGTMNNYFSVELRKAYAEWQKSLGFTGTDADGIPGPSSLEALGFNVIV